MTDLLFTVAIGATFVGVIAGAAATVLLALLGVVNLAAHLDRRIAALRAQRRTRQAVARPDGVHDADTIELARPWLTIPVDVDHGARTVLADSWAEW